MDRRTLIATSVTLRRLAAALDGDDRPFILTGCWADGCTVAGSAPMKVVAPADDPFTAFDAPAAFTETDGAVRFGGGWVGHLGFALARTLETLPPSPPSRGATSAPHALGFYDHVLVLEPDGNCWFEHLDLPDRVEVIAARLQTLRARLVAADPLPVTAAGRVSGLSLTEAQAGAHRTAVVSAINRIADGEIFQANLCLRLDGTIEGEALGTWLALMSPQPAAFGAYLRNGEQALLSCSPELFLRRKGRTVESLPMKGTRPRVDRDDDAAAELAVAPKDGAENVMIVDLMRNDFGRVCEYGSIRVGPAEVQSHPGVWQLVRRVTGTLRPGVSDGELIRACFPPGSVVGAPKIQALKVIAAEESAARGAHCGAIGYVSPHAGLEFSVAIRTLEVDGTHVALGVGGGIVADSDPDSEVEECRVKAAPLRAALDLAADPCTRRKDRTSRPLQPLLVDGRQRPDPARGLLETVALTDGQAVHIERHFARLRASAEALHGSVPDLAFCLSEIEELADAGANAARVVAVLTDSGWTVTVTERSAPPEAGVAVLLAPVLLPGGLGAHKWADRSTVAAAPAPPQTTWLVCDRTGEVLEAAWANLWIREGDTVITPPADGRLLPGVRRGLILDDPSTVGAAHARAEPVTLDRIDAADACFLTSALRIVAARVAAQVVAPAAPSRAGYHP